MKKLMELDAAISMIKDKDVVAVSGFQLCGSATFLFHGLLNFYQKNEHPKDLTLVQAAGNLGVHSMTTDGLFARYITGHFANNKKMIEMTNKNEIEAYNFPQGVISHIFRAAAAGKVGEISKIGLNTFCDPRYGGGKMNELTKEDLVKLIEIEGEEHLLYKAPKFNVALVRGTTADEHGNISIEEESFPIDILDVVMAVKANGGKVIVQVKNYVSSASMNRTNVLIPGTMVDAIVLCNEPEKYHMQTPEAFYDPALAGHYRLNDLSFSQIPLDERKIIARRTAMELKENAVVNLGIGIPECVANVATEEGIGDNLTLTLESGMIGGIPAGGAHFGSSYNAWAALPMCSQFDYYNGKNLTFASLGFAEVDSSGNINVSRFGTRIAGCGGFVDISQSTFEVVFSGTLTAGGLQVEVKDGKVNIIQEGKRKKFLNSIEQITFSSKMAIKNKQIIKFVTERCVFELKDSGLVLTEIAPGIDIEKHILANMEFKPEIAKEVKTMDARIFEEKLMNLKSMFK